ncbi:MAG: hypothetical protein K2P78_06440, partial [Gemmataceae bacterium]|nr:hypothetical protein [Gemmataceae bacterium]
MTRQLPFHTKSWIRSLFARPHRRPIRRRVLGHLEELEDRLPPANAVWTGLGDSFSWLDPLNWQGGRVPGSGDDVALGSAAARVRLAGTSLGAAAGGQVVLAGVTAYAHGATGSGQLRTWAAAGSGSALRLPNLTQVTGGVYYDSRLAVTAWGGGLVSLPSVLRVVDPSDGDTNYRSVDATATGANSRADLIALTTFTDQNGRDFGAGRYSTLAAVSGGTIAAPNLLDARGVNLDLDGTGTLATAQLRTFDSGRVRVTGGAPAFTNLRQATDTEFAADGVALTFPTLARADGAEFAAVNGGGLAFSQVTSYAHAATGNSVHRSWTADRAGSVVALPALTRIDGGTFYDSRLALTAGGGGALLDLRSVVRIADPPTGDLNGRAVNVWAEGVGSRVRLASLASFTDRLGGTTPGSAAGSTVTARYEGRVELPAAGTTSFQGVNLTADVRGVIRGNLAVLEQSRLVGGGTVEGSVTTTGTVAPAAVAADGTSLTVAVPAWAVTGVVRLERETVGAFLQ